MPRLESHVRVRSESRKKAGYRLGIPAIASQSLKLRYSAPKTMLARMLMTICAFGLEVIRITRLMLLFHICASHRAA